MKNVELKTAQRIINEPSLGSQRRFYINKEAFCFFEEDFTIEDCVIYKTGKTVDILIEGDKSQKGKNKRGSLLSHTKFGKVEILPNCPDWLLLEIQESLFLSFGYILDEIEATFEDKDVVVKDNFATIRLLGKQMPAPDWTKPSFTIKKKEGETEIETEIINCTPHSISIQTGEGKTTFAPSGIVPRVSTIQEETLGINNFPCVTSTLGEVRGLPDPEPNKVFIVSGMVFSATDRADIIAPDTGTTAIRNEKGHIIAVTRFLRK